MSKTPEHKPRPLIDLLVSIILPSIILMKFSGENDLGASGALIIALAFPLGWGIFELVKYRKFIYRFAGLSQCSTYRRYWFI